MSQTAATRRHFAIAKHYMNKDAMNEFSFFFDVIDIDGECFQVSIENTIGIGPYKKALAMAHNIAVSSVLSTYPGASIKLREYHAFKGDYVTKYTRLDLGK